MSKGVVTDLYRPKELSWLAFNERVLQEAMNSDVPLIERFKFLGIYSNNLDEFFRVRVATLQRMAEIDSAKASRILGEDPQRILNELNQTVLEQRTRYEEAYAILLKELEQYNIFFVNESELSPKQRDFVLKYFVQKVRPRLMPVMLDQVKQFPDLEDDAIYLAISLTKGNSKKRYAIIKVPCDSLPRFLILPRKLSRKYMMFLDDVIRLGLADLFHVFDFERIEAYTIKLTKDAELDIRDDFGASYLQKVSEGLKKRDEGDPVRLVYDASMPKHFLELLKKNIGITQNDTIIPGGRYHNLKDLMDFPNLGTKRLVYEPFVPLNHPSVVRGQSIFASIRERDILVHYPYHSFTLFIDLMREASIDPLVSSIKITLYRLARNSNVINALMNAVRNGKEVTAVVELQARFDERSNIEYSNKLREEGVKVIFGIDGLKIHSKLCQITRRENGNDILYSCVGTGNFNEESARVFSDAMVMTTHPGISDEVSQVFNFFNRNYEIGTYNYLLPSPFKLRESLTQLIRREAGAARAGLPAYIHLKLNNLVDQDLINELYEASLAGVEIKLNIRGMFSMVLNPDDPRTRNIQAMAIIDRFLEHTRIFIFCNSGNELCYISSADLMTRNIDRRVEVTCPILDPALKKEFRDFFDIQWADNTKARILDAGLTNQYRLCKGTPERRAQMDFYRYLQQKTQNSHLVK